MRESIREFVGVVAKTLAIPEPIFEFGSFQTLGQEGFADLRPFFVGKEYIGCDMRKGPGVDRILDLNNIELPSESAGTVLMIDTLEHVEYCRKAIDEVYRILRPGGILVMTSVMKCQIHDYPYDYWRFTPEAFKSLLKPFHMLFVDFAGGEKNFPEIIIGIGVKNQTVSLDKFYPVFNIWKQKWSKPPQIESLKMLIKLLSPPIVMILYGKLMRMLKKQII